MQRFLIFARGITIRDETCARLDIGSLPAHEQCADGDTGVHAAAEATGNCNVVVPIDHHLLRLYPTSLVAKTIIINTVMLGVVGPHL